MDIAMLNMLQELFHSLDNPLKFTTESLKPCLSAWHLMGNLLTQQDSSGLAVFMVLYQKLHKKRHETGFLIHLQWEKYLKNSLKIGKDIGR